MKALYTFLLVLSFTVGFMLCKPPAFAGKTTNTTEYKDGSSVQLENDKSFSGTADNALGVLDGTRVQGTGTQISSTGNNALLFVSRGGVVALKNAALTGTGLTDSAVVLMHRMFSSETAGQSGITLNNSSMHLTVDPNNDQPLFSVTSTDNATPVFVNLENTALRADRLDNRNTFVDLAGYATLRGAGAGGGRSSVLVDNAASGTTALNVFGAEARLDNTDITVSSGGGTAVFVQEGVHYPFLEPGPVVTAPNFVFTNGSIKADTGNGLAVLVKSGSVSLGDAVVASNGYGVYFQGRSEPSTFTFAADGLHVAVSDTAQAAVLFNKVSTQTVADPNAAFAFSNSLLESAGDKTVWIYDNAYDDRNKNLSFTNTTIQNTGGNNAFYVNGAQAANTSVRLVNSAVLGDIHVDKGAGATTLFSLDNSTLDADFVRSVQGTDSLRLQLANGSRAAAAVRNVTALDIDAASMWTLKPDVLADATVNDTLNIRGALAFGADRLPIATRAGALPFGTLSVGHLTGNGLFYMKTDIDADMADNLRIQGDSSGSHRLYVANSGADPSRERMSAYLATREGGNAAFALANPDGVVDAGTYAYRLDDEALAGGAGQGWFLRRTEELTPAAATARALTRISVAYTVWHGQLDNLRQRLGELRSGTAQNGVWMRGFADSRRFDVGDGFRQHLQGGSLGYDWSGADGDNRWFAGARGQMTGATQDLDGPGTKTGRSRSTGGAVYGTWLHADGWYADAVVALDRHWQEMEAARYGQKTISGDYSVWGYGAGLELGRRWDFVAGLFLEPQIQLSWYRVDPVSYNLDNGLHVHADGVDSLTGRAGLVAGKRWDFDNGRSAQVYLKGGADDEFLSDQTISINSYEFTADIKGPRVYYGAGATAQLTENCGLYGEFEREQGQHMNTDWSVNAGLRYTF